jgi:hypothetical protein
MTTTREREAGAIPVLARSTALQILDPPAVGTATATDIVDQWGMQSFPASDPPANW